MSRSTFVVEPEVQVVPLTAILFETPLRFTGFGLSSTTASKYVAMLYSHTLLDSVAGKFDLKTIYGVPTRDELHEELLNNVIFRDNLDGTVSIMCYYQDEPDKAAAIANSFFELLMGMDERLNRRMATEFRIFMEENYKDALDNLSQAEINFRDYQLKYGVVNLEEQITKIVELLSSLESEKIMFEIKRDYLWEIVQGDYPELLSLMTRIGAIEDKIKALKGDSLYTSLTTSDLPDRELQHLRLYREVLIREKVVEFLITQVEQAKIDERKKTTNLLLLEEAVPAESYARPRRLQIITLTIFFGFFASVFFVQILEFYDRNKEELKKIVTEEDTT